MDLVDRDPVCDRLLARTSPRVRRNHPYDSGVVEVSPKRQPPPEPSEPIQQAIDEQTHMIIPDPAKLAATIEDLGDMVRGRGRHAGHKQRQVGRCVICSCGVRAQGRI